jgi:hypothetical protein
MIDAKQDGQALPPSLPSSPAVCRLPPVAQMIHGRSETASAELFESSVPHIQIWSVNKYHTFVCCVWFVAIGLSHHGEWHVCCCCCFCASMKFLLATPVGSQMVIIIGGTTLTLAIENFGSAKLIALLPNAPGRQALMS